MVVETTSSTGWTFQWCFESPFENSRLTFFCMFVSTQQMCYCANYFVCAWSLHEWSHPSKRQKETAPVRYTVERDHVAHPQLHKSADMRTTKITRFFARVRVVCVAVCTRITCGVNELIPFTHNLQTSRRSGERGDALATM